MGLDEIDSLRRRLSDEHHRRATNYWKKDKEALESGQSLDQLFGIEKYHRKGITGKGIMVAIFDSGLAQKYLDQQTKSLSLVDL